MVVLDTTRFFNRHGFWSPSRPSFDDPLRFAAEQLARPPLSSGETLCLTLPAPALAAHRLLAEPPGDWGRGEEGFFYSPSPDQAWVGLGAAEVLRGQGPGRFAQLCSAVARRAGAWHCVTHPGSMPFEPRFFGGLAFAPGSARHGGWRSFGDARFVLPRWLYRRQGEEASVTLSVRGSELASRSARDVLTSELVALLEHLGSDHRGAPATPGPGALRSVIETPPRALWQQGVAAARRAIGAGHFDKVVLAHAFRIERAVAIDGVAVLDRLLASAAPGVTCFAFRQRGVTFLGATPERLVAQQGERLWSEALAGTARGAADPAELLASSKDRHEHALVVDDVRRRLAPWCDELRVPSIPRVRSLGAVQHLHTPILGTLKGGQRRHVLELAERLHPTPAVGGLPRAGVSEWIRRHEAEERGWYAGPVGWFDRRGDGELRVALRCCLVEGKRAWLPVGAGLVADSEAAAEYRETELKSRTLVAALLTPEHGQAARVEARRSVA